MSFGKIYVGSNVDTLETSPKFDTYTAVELRADSNSEPIIAGDQSAGRTLNVVCIYASEQMARDILAQVNGYSYQPYDARSAMIEPAAEIGDGVTLSGIYSGIFVQNTTYSRMMLSDIKAPEDEELAHEYGYIGEDGKYATYAALANGSVSINGAGIQDSTIVDAKISDVSGGKLFNGSVGGGKIAGSNIDFGHLTGGVNGDIGKGVDAYNRLAYGFSAISTNQLYAQQLMVGDSLTEAYWCYKNGMYYLGHY